VINEFQMNCNMTSFTLKEILTATKGTACGFPNSNSVFSGIGIDSRKIDAGELFWAIPGEHHDGHDYLIEAIQKGALACVVDKDKQIQFDGSCITVPDSKAALSQFANWHRLQQDALVIGITGSFGKTTTREMTHTVLEMEFNGVRSQRNFNNHIGLPLSLLNIRKQDEYAVLEMGASHEGEIQKLADIALPEIGVVTGIGLSHVEGFGSLKQITKTKGELLEALPSSGFAVLAGDDPAVREISNRASCPVIFVGENQNNQLRAENIEQTNKTISFQSDGQKYSISASGKHHVQSAIIAIGIARELGMKTEMIAEGLREFTPVAGRCRLEEIGPWHVIDDTYNANPQSMRAACDVLRNWQGNGQKILITGDMLELGGQAVECHHEIGQMAVKAGVDQLIVHGQYASEVIRGARDFGMDHFRLAECDSFEAMTTVLDCWLEPEDVVLVKGSRGMRMERVIDWLKLQSVTKTGYQTDGELRERMVA
jgi:UDP-N-acetylmuramoyl-tripeptide--D-alanyl-D-alanine ligase